MKKAIGIIPARYGSSRFPGKPLADICGKPMVVRVYERAMQAQSLDEVLVATDDERILDAVKSHGGVAVMTAKSHPNGTNRLVEAAANRDAEFFINIQGDEPLLDPRMIDQIVAAMGENPAIPVVTMGKPIRDGLDEPNVVKVVTDLKGFALYFSRSVIPYPRHAEFQHCAEHIGIYGYTQEFLRHFLDLAVGDLEKCESLEQLRVLENGHKIRVLTWNFPYEGLSVDSEADLERVRLIFREEMK